MKVYYYDLNTKFRKLWIAFTDKGVVNITISSKDNGDNKDVFLNWINKYFDEIIECNDNEKKYNNEIIEYLIGNKPNIQVPVDLIGTEFQKKVWLELSKIPYGETRTYKDIATAIGNEKSSRAVGMANNRNPIPIVIPCHRVIGSSGDLVGYDGGLDIKVDLLELEGNIIDKTVKDGYTRYFLRKSTV